MGWMATEPVESWYVGRRALKLVTALNEVCTVEWGKVSHRSVSWFCYGVTLCHQFCHTASRGWRTLSPSHCEAPMSKWGRRSVRLDTCTIVCAACTGMQNRKCWLTEKTRIRSQASPCGICYLRYKGQSAWDLRSTEGSPPGICGLQKASRVGFVVYNEQSAWDLWSKEGSSRGIRGLQRARKYKCVWNTLKLFFIMSDPRFESWCW